VAERRRGSGFVLGLARAVPASGSFRRFSLGAPSLGCRRRYYPGALFVTGFLGGLALPTHPGAVALGIVVGQVLVLLGRVVADPTSGGLWPLGVLFLGLYGLVALVGAGVGSAVGRRRGGEAPPGGPSR
jgi:hypothetical protein